MRTSRTSRVFVYGTLRRGGANAHVLGPSPFVGRASVSGLACFDLGPYPACIRAEQTSRVFGEVFTVDARTLRDLDRLEGTPNLYRRETCSAVLESGETVPAFVYVFVPPIPAWCPRVRSGRWNPRASRR